MSSGCVYFYVVHRVPLTTSRLEKRLKPLITGLELCSLIPKVLRRRGWGGLEEVGVVEKNIYRLKKSSACFQAASKLLSPCFYPYSRLSHKAA